jgi:hypothetical protein
MKLSRKTYYVLMGLVIISGLIFFTGCASSDKNPAPANNIKTPADIPIKEPLPADAHGLLQRAVENSLSARSYTAQMLMNTEMMGMQMAFNLDIKKYNNIFYETGNIMEMNFEVYSDGKNIAVKDPMKQKWSRLPLEEQNLIFSFEQMQRKIYLEYVEDTHFTGEEKIGENDCKIIEASVNPERMKEIIEKQNLPMTQMGDIAFDKMLLKIWVGKDDGLFYRSSASVTATMNMALPGLPNDEEGNRKKEKDIEDEEDPPNPPDKQPATTPDNKPSPSGKGMMTLKYSVEVWYANYNKVEPIVIPPEVQKIMANPAEKDLEEKKR